MLELGLHGSVVVGLDLEGLVQPEQFFNFESTYQSLLYYFDHHPDPQLLGSPGCSEDLENPATGKAYGSASTP